MTPGALEAAVSSATLGLLMISKTSRRNLTLNAISTPPPSTVASTMVSFLPVSSDVADISTSPEAEPLLEALMSSRATFEPSRAKISACLQALSREAVEMSVRDL